jgi:hypothetical protein
MTRKHGLFVIITLGLLVPIVVPVVVDAASSGITANQILTAAPAAVDLAGSSATQGSALSMARADHNHSLTGQIDTIHIAANAVTDAKLRTGAGTSVIGRASNSSGNVADVAASADGEYLQRQSGALTWNGLSMSDVTSGVLGVGNGGTGASSLPQGAAYSTGSALATTAGTTTTVLHGNAAGNPSFSAVDLTADVTGVLPTTNGGTGSAGALKATVFGNDTSSNLTAPAFNGDAWLGQGYEAGSAYSLTVGGFYGTSKLGGIRFKQSSNAGVVLYVPNTPSLLADVPFALPTADGSAGYPLKTDGSGALSFGVLGVPGGGTGLATITAHGVLLGEGTSNVTPLASTSDALHILQSQSGADPVWTNNPSVSTLTAINTSPSITLGTATSATGGIAFKGSGGSNTTTLTVPSSNGAVTVTLPTVATTMPTANPGTSGMCLQATTGGTQSYAALNLGTAALVTGQLGAAAGGTGIDTSASTGVPSISSGTWSVATTLATSKGGLGGNFGSSAGALSISSGTVSAGTLSVGNGGTGSTSFGASAGALITSGTSGTGALGRVDAVALGNILISQGTATVPTWLGVQTCTVASGTTCTITTWRSGCTQVCGPGSTVGGLKSSSVSGTTLTCTFVTTGSNTCACICP